jgi:hypothetical protein
MNILNLFKSRPVAYPIALIACGFSLLAVPALKAAEPATLQPRADTAPSLPLVASFTKVAGAEKGPFVLTLKNTSTAPVKVTTKILLALAAHADNKARNIPEHEIAAGQSWSIADLVLDDRVILTAPGFATLELKVQ